MKTKLIEKFRIDGLHGYKNVEIDFSGPARIIIAENGTGKTTILAALNAFLKRDFFRLSKIKFDRIECVLKGLDEPLSIARSDLNFPDASSELESLAQYSSISALEIREVIQNLGKEEPFIGNSLLHEIYVQSPYDLEEFEAIISRVRSSLFEIPKSVIEISEKLSRVLDGIDLLYLPTYRRVELPSQKTSIQRRAVSRRSRAPINSDAVRYGLGDVQERLAEILNDVQRYSNNQYRTISASIIDDALGGKITAAGVANRKLPDIDALRLFFSRVATDQSKSDRLESLKALYESREIESGDQLTLRYFLSKLNAVVEQTKQLESSVETFVEKVNVYLKMSSDEKTLTYDSNNMKVLVSNAFTRDGIDLDDLSSGEKQVISLFSHLYLHGGPKIVLMDEPELSLSMDWQKRLLPDVVNAPSCLQLLAITHSPYIFENELDPYAGPLKVERTNKESM